MTARFHHSLLALTVSLLITGCAVNEPVPEQPPAPPVPVTAEQKEAPTVYGQFPTDTLFALLTAEIAGQRNRFDIALNNYLEQAVRTRDAGIIERAMEISEFLGAHQQAMDMALLWSEVEPDNPEALRAAALQLARAGEHDEAMQMMEQVLLLQDDTHFDLLALTALQADSATRAAMLENLQRLLQRYPDNPQLSFAAALLLQEEQRSEEALALLDEHTRQNRTAASIMLQSRLHAGMGETDDAIEVLQQGVREFPDDDRMRLLLARMLVSDGDHPAAIVHFQELVRQHPDDDEVRLALALVELEGGETDAAINELETLLELDPENEAAQYHLGAAYQHAEQWDAAIRSWQSISAGEHYLPSRLRITQLLMERQRTDELGKIMDSERAGHPQLAAELYLLEIEALAEVEPQRAMQRANQAIQQLPSDSRLLYTRAMLADRLGNPAGLEADLRKIIQREPDNAMALNALGYTFADRNERLDEALQLIERAHELKPDDPAILDSLGWVHYRLGDLERAEQLLRDAFAAFPDEEVGAHLGEVLWQRGKHREAREIWDQAAEAADDTALIDATRKRLKAD